MIVETLVPAHLKSLMVQPAQARFGVMLDDPEYCKLLCAYEGFAGISEEDGRVLGCAGVIPQWEGRAIAWSLLGDIGPRKFIAGHRAVARWLELSDYRWLETWVEARHREGRRWAEMLGFRRHKPMMRGFFPDGGDAWLYSRTLKR